MERIEIQPASVAQVHRALRTGRLVGIGDDVQNIAADLRAIRDTLKLEYDPGEDVWIVRDTVTKPDGSTEDKLVTTWDCDRNGQLDQRLVQLVRQIASPDYNLAAELDKADRAADRERARQFREKVGPAAERLRHALRKDLGVKSRAFVPEAIERG